VGLAPKTQAVPDLSVRSARSPQEADRLAERDIPPGSRVGRQRWNHLLFAHWPVDPRQVQATLPRGLWVDTFDGVAYVGVVPFFMERVRPVGLPALPWLSWFLELNVRTYVHDAQGHSGVWFYSLDCNQPIAVLIAQHFFHLPYFHARMSSRRGAGGIHFESQRRGVAGGAHRFSWHPGDETEPARLAVPGTLDFFLVERYRLFAADRAGRLRQGRVHHAPYRLHTPVVSEFSTEPARQAGFDLSGPPVSLLAARAVDVSIFKLREVPAGGG